MFKKMIIAVFAMAMVAGAQATAAPDEPTFQGAGRGAGRGSGRMQQARPAAEGPAVCEQCREKMQKFRQQRRDGQDVQRPGLCEECQKKMQQFRQRRQRMRQARDEQAEFGRGRGGAEAKLERSRHGKKQADEARSAGAQHSRAQGKKNVDGAKMRSMRRDGRLGRQQMSRKPMRQQDRRQEVENYPMGGQRSGRGMLGRGWGEQAWRGMGQMQGRGVRQQRRGRYMERQDMMQRPQLCSECQREMREYGQRMRRGQMRRGRMGQRQMDGQMDRPGMRRFQRDDEFRGRGMQDRPMRGFRQGRGGWERPERGQRWRGRE